MIDIEKIKQAALEALDNMDDYARMECGIEPIGATNHLTHFITTVCERLEAAERGLSTYTEMYNRVYDELQGANQEIERLEWIIGLHPTIDSSVIASTAGIRAMKETK